MTTLFLLFPENARQANPRSYLLGFVLSANLVSGPSLVDNVLTYRDNFNVDYHVEFYPNLMPWSSNTYTQDHFFDLDNCHAYIAGVEVISGLFYGVGYHINENERRIKIVSGGGAGTDYVFDFESAPADYWYPYSP